MKELEKFELGEVNGGTWPIWVRGSLWTLVGGYIIEHWPDFKSGIIDGYTDAQKANG